MAVVAPDIVRFDENWPGGVEYTPLVGDECKYVDYQGMARINTATFFTIKDPKGRAATQAVEIVKQALKPVLEANPWIAGRFVQRKGVDSVPQIMYPKSRGGELVDAICIEQQAEVHKDMPYAELSKVMLGNPIFKAAGNNYKNQPKHFCHFLVFPDAKNKDGFVLLFAVSHTVADGKGYYAVLQQLQAEAEKVQLSVVRKENHAFSPAIKEMEGEKEYAYSRGGLSMVCGILSNMMNGKKTHVFANFLDSEAVAKVKQEAGEHCSAGFVSTNDVVTSEFGHLAKARLLFTACNWNGRVEGVDERDVGNYNGGILFDPEGYATPGKIRETLAGGKPYKRKSERPLPGCCGACSCCCCSNHLCGYSSWLFPGFTSFLDGCELDLHLPMQDNPGFSSQAVLFWAKPKQPALIIWSKTCTQTTMSKESSIFGASVAPSMF